jgi:hypothetical protein
LKNGKKENILLTVFVPCKKSNHLSRTISPSLKEKLFKTDIPWQGAQYDFLCSRALFGDPDLERPCTYCFIRFPCVGFWKKSCISLSHTRKIHPSRTAAVVHLYSACRSRS